MVSPKTLHARAHRRLLLVLVPLALLAATLVATWTLAASPARPASPWLALALGLALTGALCLLLLQNVRRERYARELVAEKLRAQYRIQRELRSSEERHRSVVEQLEEGVVLLDGDLDILTANAAAQRIFGRPATELVGRSWLDSAWGAVRDDGSPYPAAERPVSVARQTGEPQLDGLIGIHRPDGRVAWLATNASPLRYLREDAPYAIVCSFVDVTESRARRRQLERQRTELADAQHISATGSWSADGGGVAVWSEELRRILGVRLDDVPPDVDGYVALVHPDDRERVAGELGAAFAAGRACDSDHRMLRPDEREIHVHARVRAELGAGGEVLRVYGTTQDITDRVAAQRALRDSEERFRRVAASAPVAIVEADAAGRVSWVNDEWRELTGQTRLDALGDGWTAALVAEERAAAVAAWEAGVAGGEDFSLEHRLCGVSGAVVQMSGYAAPLRGPRGEVTGWIGTTLDVTAARDAEERRREAEEKFRSAFERAPIGMALTSLDGRFMEVNPALAELLGRPRETLAGMALSELTHPEDVARDSEAMAAMIRGDTDSFETEKRYLHADGGAVWVALQATIVRAQGSPGHFLFQIQDVTDRRSYQERLEFMADHDPLTGLLNRRSFERELDRHDKKVRRDGERGAVVVLDLDHFKVVNDSLGHTAGDKLIVGIAERLAGRLRESDVVARLGGDEFAILLPDASAAEAVLVAEQLLEAIRVEAVPVMGRPRRVTASIGVAPVVHREGLAGEDLLVSADLAMYDAKEAGRDRVARYAAGPHERDRTEARLSWAERIREALDHDDFELHAQPIVDLGTGIISQWELLVRMRSEDGDLIPPGAFLSVAERYGLIQELDRWVLRRAIGLLARAQAARHPLVLEVNVSGRSMGDPRVLETVERELATTGVRGEDLILEITETAAVENIPQAQAFGRRLSELGCRFALDDFGAGFGSFYYLKHLPFDVLKIDGEFIRNCRTNPVDRLVIQAVVDIARGLGKHTVAEFVGDDETMALLRAHGVDYAQGFHLGKPAPLLDQLPALV